MKTITKSTILKQGDKVFEASGRCENYLWFDNNTDDMRPIAQSQPNIEGIPVISLEGLNSYTKEDIEKAINTAWVFAQDRNANLTDTIDLIFTQINQISEIEVDENFNIINYK